MPLHLSRTVWVVLLLTGMAGQWVLDARGDRATDFVTGAILHGIATAGYVGLCRQVIRRRWSPGFASALLLVVGIRLLALPLQPALSDDIYRYLHEGSMVLAGENPYLTAPEDVSPTLRHPVYWERMNNKEVPAAYPPATQFALAAGVLLHPTPLGMKLLFGTLDLLVFFVLWWWLPSIGARSCLAVVHGFCPLMALEFAGEGHSDSLAVLGIVGGLALAARHRWHAAAAALSIAVAAKLMPIVLLPFFARRRPAILVTFVVVLGLLYAPFVVDVPVREWPRLFTGAARYAEAWRANDSLFHLLLEGSRWLLDSLAASGIETNLRYYPHTLAKVPVALFGMILLLCAWLRQWPLQKVAASVFMLFVSFAPTMHPWYLAFLVPFLALYPHTLWLVFTGTVFLAYHVRPDWIRFAHWAENEWVKVAEYLPFFLGFLGVLIDTRRKAATDQQTRRSNS